MSEFALTRDEMDGAFEVLTVDPDEFNPGYRLHRAADIRPEAVRWLWTGRVPAGTLTVLDGDPGKGKSTLTATLAAAVSTGRALPGDHQLHRGGVIFVSLEDDPAMVIVPRLIAADADLSRVHIPRILDSYGERLPLLPDDLGRLQQMITETEAKLVVVDPLMAALSREVNGNQDQEVRRVLAELTRIAGDTGAAILLVRHLNKSAGTVAIYRGGGSIGIIGAARSGLLLTQHPSDPSQLLLAVTKSNLGVRPKALSLRIVQAKNGFGAVEWGEESEISADDALNGRNPDEDEDEAAERSAAEQWLIAALAEGSVPAKQIFAEAKENGFSPDQIRRAKAKVRVVSIRIGGRDGGQWEWRMPEAALNMADQGHTPPPSPSSPSLPPSDESGDTHIYKESVINLQTPHVDDLVLPSPLDESPTSQRLQRWQTLHESGDTPSSLDAVPSSPGTEVLTDPWDGDDPDWPTDPPSYDCATCLADEPEPPASTSAESAVDVPAEPILIFADEDGGEGDIQAYCMGGCGRLVPVDPGRCPSCAETYAYLQEQMLERAERLRTT